MKKSIMIVAMMAVMAAVNAQPREQHQPKQLTPEQQEQQFNKRVERLGEQLELTDAQKPQFAALYREYSKAIKAVKKPGEKPEPTDDVNVEAARVKQHMATQKTVIDIRMDYVDRFAAILNAKQLHKFYQLDKPGGKGGPHGKDMRKGKKDGKRDGERRHGKKGKRGGKHGGQHDGQRPAGNRPNQQAE